MAPTPVKEYSITGNGAWNDHRLEIRESGVPFLWANSNNKYGPWKDPYVTLHEECHNGQIVAAAKMGCPGWKKDFRIFLGNPDCTDLKTWPEVKCFGPWRMNTNSALTLVAGFHFNLCGGGQGTKTWVLLVKRIGTSSLWRSIRPGDIEVPIWPLTQ